MHYSPYNGEVRPGYMFTDTGFWDTFRCLFPFLNPDVSVNESEDAGRFGKRLQRERIPAGMGQSGTPGLYGGQQFGFRSDRRLHQRFARI